MKKIIINLLLFATLNCLSQSLNYQWAETAGSSLTDRATSVVTDALGNVYTLGVFNGNVDFDPSAVFFNISSLSSSDDIFIQKLDPNGNFIWAKRIGGTLNDWGSSIELDALGNVYIAGYYRGTADFDPNTTTSFNLTSAGLQDAFVCKLTSSGNFVWAKSFGGTGNDEANGIALDASNNVLITGNFNSTADFDPSTAIVSLTSNGAYDVFISKLDVNGNFIWAKTFGGLTSDRSLSIKIDASANIFICGNFAGTVDFDPSASVYNITALGNSDAFVGKFTSTGAFVWAKQFGGGSSSNVFGNGVFLDTFGDVYTVGHWTGSSVDFDPSVAIYNLNSLAGFDAFVSKLDNNGNFISAFNINGTNSEVILAIAIDNLNNVYVTGFFSGVVDLDPGTSTFTISSSSTADSDFFVSKYDASGNFLYGASFGNTGQDYGLAITTNSNNVYISGFFELTVDFDPSSAIANQVSVGNYDAFTQKLQSVCLAPASPTNITAPIDQILCQNASTTLSATGTGTINWFTSPTGGTSISTGSTFPVPLLSAGVYTYYASALTCTNSLTRTPITVTVVALPNVNVSATNSLFCVGQIQTTTLTASGASTYTWSNGPIANNIVYTPTITTTFTVFGTSSPHGCINSAIITLSVNSCTGLITNRNEVELPIKLYPNPAHASVFLDSNLEAKLEVRNLLGQLLIKINLHEGINDLTIADLPPGVYNVSVIKQSNVDVMKLIKQ